MKDTAVEPWVLRTVSGLLGADDGDIDLADSLYDIGLQSITLMQLLELARRELGLSLGYGDAIGARDVIGLADAIAGAEHVEAATVEEGLEEDGDGSFPLSVMSHAYWAGRQDASGDVGEAAHFYHEFAAGGVDPATLSRALGKLYDRHPMLRAAVDESGRQRIVERPFHPECTVHDFSSRSEEEARELLLAVRRDMASKRMDLSSGEVLDVHLTLLPGDATVLHVLLDMGVADARSFRSLLNDLAGFYNGRDAELPPLAATYREYIEGAWRRIGDEEESRAWWASRLEALGSAPSLPASASPLPRPSGSYRLGFRMSEDETVGLDGLAMRIGTTQTAVLMAVFARVVGAWAAEEPFLLNVPVFTRPAGIRDLDKVVGDFTGSVLVTFGPSGRETLGEACLRTGAELAEALSHRSYSGVEVLRDLSKTRGEAVRAPVVFTSAMGIGDLFSEEFRTTFGGPSWIVSHSPHVWLDAQVSLLEGGLHVNWDVREGVFADGVVEAMFGAYEGLVRAAASGALSEGVPLEVGVPGPQALARRERQSAADAAVPAPLPGGLLQDGLLEAARRDPSAVAVSDGSGETTYGELAGRARSVAAALALAGARPGDRVGVSLPKSAAQVAAVLGALEAGCCYVPVDPLLPEARKASIAAEAGLSAVVCAEGGAGWAPGAAAVPADPPAREWSPGRRADPSEPAYVIFTSGSTGAPRGVVVSHAAAKNTVEDVAARFGLCGADVALGVSGLGFDLSVFDLFGVLGRGGRLVLVDQGAFADPARWLEAAGREGATVWNSAPAQMSMVLDAAPAGSRALSSLRLALLSGDWVPVDVLARLAPFAPGAAVVALGGATEAAIWSNFHVVREGDEAGPSIPYGVALSGQRMDVLDAALRPRPDLAVGEICIAGAGLAEGYLGRPELTQERFVEAPGGERWYRTGDLGRWLPCGEVEFLGRRDTQVKIRGNRVELAEVEAALTAHPHVRRAVSVVLGEKSERSIASAVVMEEGSPEDARALVAHQGSLLPAAAVCTKISFLGELPLTANGKVDRKRILRMLSDAPFEDEPDEPPRPGLERKVADAWASVLGTDVRDRGDSFFLLGGDSLSGTRLVAALKLDGLDAKLSYLFESPALKDFCARLGEREPDERVGLEEQAGSPFDPFPLTEVQSAYLIGRDPSLVLGGIGCTFYRQYRAASLDVRRLEGAVDAVVARHPMLRAVVCDGGQRVLEEVPRFSSEAFADEKAMHDALSRRVFDAGRWPLFSIGTVAKGPDAAIGVAFDNIMMDASSVLLFLDEVERAYSDPRSLGREPRMAFRDYVLSVRGGEGRAEDREYWARRGSEMPPAPPLPLAVDPSMVRAPRFGRLTATLHDAAPALSAECSKRGTTLPSLAFAAYGETLRRYSGAKGLSVTVTTFDRQQVHPDVGRVIGDFTTLMYSSYEPSPEETWGERVSTASRDLADDLDHAYEGAASLARASSEAFSGGIPVVFTAALGAEQEFRSNGPLFSRFGEGMSQTPQTWLDCQVSTSGDDLVLNWDHVEGLFPDGFLEEAFGYFSELVGWSASGGWDAAPPDPGDRADAGCCGAHAEGHRTEGSRATLHGGFFAHARSRPDEVAIFIDGKGDTTYGELAASAAAVAHALRAEGLPSDSRVLVTAADPARRVAAAMGTMAAGMVYVPVGADQPEARIAEIASICGARRVLDDARVAAAGAASVRAEPIAADPDEPAYAIFTSGTTGAPKGILISHRQAMSTVDEVAKMCPGPIRTLAASAPDFDLSIFDVFGALAYGGSVVFARTEDRRDSQAFVGAARAGAATVWNSVPALLEMALACAKAGDLSSLRTVLVSGDKVPLDLHRRLLEAAPEARLIALGGATECSIWSNYFEPAAEAGWEDESPSWVSMPYGRPLPGQSFGVVGENGEVCPCWTVGELAIRGCGVGLGYLNADGGFRGSGEDREYLTGDLGRIRPSGLIEILGRKDNQVKVGGTRIELGEVESVAESSACVGKATAGIAPSAGAGPSIALVVERGFERPSESAAFALDDARVPETQGGRLGDGAARIVRDALRRLEGAGSPRASEDFEGVVGVWRSWVDGLPCEPGGEGDPRIVARLVSVVSGEAELASLYDEPELDPGRQAVASPCASAALAWAGREARRRGPGAIAAVDCDRAAAGALGLDSGEWTAVPGSGCASVSEGRPSSTVLAPFSMHRFKSREDALRRARACLEPGGILIMTEFDRLSPEAMLSTVVLSHGALNPGSAGETDSTICPPRAWVDDARRLGFSFLRGADVGGGAYAMALRYCPEERTTPEGLRKVLARRVPASHLPRTVTIVDKLPLTRNGKVDRAAALALSRTDGEGEPEEPCGGLEACLAEIFEDVLSAKVLDREASLFSMGGDSLSAARISRAVQDAVCPEASLREVLENPSVAEMARVLVERHGADPSGFEEGEL